MDKALLIAEKPSLMRTIQEVYNKNKNAIPYEIVFTSQSGHLVTLKLPDELDDKLKIYSWDTLPFFPEDYGGWKYRIINQKKKSNFSTPAERYALIKNEIKSGNYDFIIHAGDPDQEGELLVNLVLEQMNNKLPVKRFWTNDLTESHVLNALQNLRDDNERSLTRLLDAAKVRQHSDYLFGMNISRGASIQMKGRVACGRVKTFIQACVVQRDDAITDFSPTTVYGVKTNYSLGFSGSLFSATAVNKDENSDADQKEGIVWYQTEEEAENVIKTLTQKAKVLVRNTTHTKTYAPKLFKLSSLQVEAGKLGYNPDQVLAIAQSLYEKQIMSYPRTSCEYLGSDENFEGILKAMNDIDELQPYINMINDSDIVRVKSTKKWINDKELESKGHSALRPTIKKLEIESLSEDERTIYMMIAKRFVAMFMPPLEQENVELITSNNGKGFKSKGKRTLTKGYTEILGIKTNDVELPECATGDELEVDNFEVAKKTTKCPSYFTQADLIALCENPIRYLDDPKLKELGKKLTVGTEATRAGIISQLIKKDHYLETFTEKKKEYVKATETGTEIIRNLDGLIICKPDMTGDWENKLEDIRNGKKVPDVAEGEIRKDLITMLNEIKEKNMVSLNQAKSLDLKCPKCGAPLIALNRVYMCSNNKKDSEHPCDFHVFKTINGANITETDLQDLLDKGRTTPKTMTSQKSGKKYKAIIKLDENYQTGLQFESNETEYVCPKCGSPIKKIGNNEHPGYGCTNNNCDFILWSTVSRKKLPEKNIKELFTDGVTSKINGFISKRGTPFSAKLKMDSNYKIIFDFGDNKSKTSQTTTSNQH